MEFIDGDGNDQRSEAQKLADRLLPLGRRIKAMVKNRNADLS